MGFQKKHYCGVSNQTAHWSPWWIWEYFAATSPIQEHKDYWDDWCTADTDDLCFFAPLHDQKLHWKLQNCPIRLRLDTNAQCGCRVLCNFMYSLAFGYRWKLNAWRPQVFALAEESLRKGLPEGSAVSEHVWFYKKLNYDARYPMGNYPRIALLSSLFKLTELAMIGYRKIIPFATVACLAESILEQVGVSLFYGEGRPRGRAALI